MGKNPSEYFCVFLQIPNRRRKTSKQIQTPGNNQMLIIDNLTA